MLQVVTMAKLSGVGLKLAWGTLNIRATRYLYSAPRSYIPENIETSWHSAMPSVRSTVFQGQPLFNPPPSDILIQAVLSIVRLLGTVLVTPGTEVTLAPLLLFGYFSLRVLLLLADRTDAST